MRQCLQALLVLSALTLLVACSDDGPAPTTTNQAPSKPATPVAVAQTPSSSISIAIPVATAEGQALYDKQCNICHGQGLLNAPKLRDTKAWQARIAKIGDMDTFYERAIGGYNKMPAQVTDGVSADDVKLAVDYIVATTAQ